MMQLRRHRFHDLGKKSHSGKFCWENTSTSKPRGPPLKIVSHRVYPHQPCQLSLSEATGENPRLLAEL